MTNRPRRSRPNRSRNKTIDGSAQTADAADSAAPTEAKTTEAGRESAAGDAGATDTFAKSEGLGDSIVETHVVEDDQTARPIEDDKPEDALTTPSQQPASAAPAGGNETIDAGLVSDAKVDTSGSSAQSSKNSDWSKTGGYSGPAAVTRTPEPSKRDSDAATASKRSDDRGASTIGGGSGSVPPVGGSGSGSGSGLGFGGALFAGLIGAIVALVVSAYLFSNGYLGSLQGGVTPEVIAEDTTAEDIENLSAELVALRRDIEASVAAGQQPSDGVAGLTQDDLQLLGDRIVALETAAVEATSGEEDATGATSDLSAFEEALSETQGSVSDLQNSATGATEAAAAAQQAAEAAQQAADEATQAVEEASQSGEAGRQELQAAIQEATDAANGRLDALEQSTARSRLALAAAGMKSAIDNGSSFAAELQTFADAGGSQDAVQVLQPYAESGVPTVQALVQRWGDVEGAVSAALTGPGADAPIQDQVMAGFRSLVEARPSGEIPAEASSPDAVVGRLDRAISSGNLQQFTTEWNSLPDDAKQAGEGFFQDVQARLAANQALTDAISATLADGSSETNGSGAGAANQNNQG